MYTSKSSAEIEAHVDLVHSVQVPELKAHLERLGLDQSGLKADLSKRLKEAEGFAAGVKEGAAASALEPADRTAQKVWITYIHTYNIHVYMHACMHAFTSTEICGAIVAAVVFPTMFSAQTCGC